MHLVRRSLSRYTAALVVLALSSAPVLAADTSNIRIDNFGRVDDNYYRGGRPEIVDPNVRGVGGEQDRKSVV